MAGEEKRVRAVLTPPNDLEDQASAALPHDHISDQRTQGRRSVPADRGDREGQSAGDHRETDATRAKLEDG